MSVYIKGVEMPNNCEECPFCDYEQGECFANRGLFVAWGHRNVRQSWCPLIPIHDHGDLIDRDAYKAEMKKRQDNCAEWRDNAKADGDMEIYHRADGALSVFCEAKLTLDKMPTIIPADKDGAE